MRLKLIVRRQGLKIGIVKCKCNGVLLVDLNKLNSRLFEYFKEMDLEISQRTFFKL